MLIRRSRAATIPVDLSSLDQVIAIHYYWLVTKMLCDGKHRKIERDGKKERKQDDGVEERVV